MKKLVWVASLFLLPGITGAQSGREEMCFFDEYARVHQVLTKEFEKKVQIFLAREKKDPSVQSNHIKTIPVVVHVIHNNGTENISDAQILSQIQILNEDYGKLPATNGDGNGVDTEVRFCLAKISPDGDCTNGIVRILSPLTVHQTVQRAQMMALSHWDPNRYLNLYVVKSINGSGILGYASFPGGPPSEDGFVCVHNYFGNMGTASSSLGRTATHECGHWFGLYHTFNGGCGVDTCLDGDYVCDTPPVAAPNFGCPVINSCSNDIPNQNDQKENYMDYTNDACKNIFTMGQKARIQATLNTVRTTIWQPANVTATGCDSTYISPPCPAVADFTTGNQTICVGNSVLFTNQSLNNCTAYQWYFPGGTPATSTAINPTVTYTAIGSYNVSLVATNSNGIDSVTQASYISATTPPVGQPLPYSEGFETTVFPPNGITIDNPDAGITWERDTIAVAYAGAGSAKINNLVNTNYGQADAMILPNLDLTSFGGTPYISFRWAYAKSDPNYSDELAVQISTDCGVNFAQIFYRTGTAMTTGATQTTPYVPTSNTVWKLCNVSLGTYATSDHAIIKIMNVTDGGNNLYIDNINIGVSAVGMNEFALAENSVLIYPNPSGGNIQFMINDSRLKNAELRLVNVFGQVVYESTLHNQQGSLTLDLPEGIYFAEIKSGGLYTVKKIIVNKN